MLFDESTLKYTKIPLWWNSMKVIFSGGIKDNSLKFLEMTIPVNIYDEL